ncbi:hypothetical protein K458DRAFT_347864 [Lentithecium fluviatile CBS 122367]|uniref:C2H2-type domain-containing protein n=1 Tax=Lentithecium fluviatile CBS 122367 TaxID=1168545 RepID=A0A6G1IM16_9PLEO|nr:hypothetical protein K458DRAFT_347864 [Lentithecium fluviatile CBS 122367]
MTKKRKRYPDLQQKLERPWCFYCERDFDDLKILISHQKAKHFKCDRCGRRLNTAGGLSVHMNQVHKENLTHVENAIQGRGGLEIEIFGMEGVPEEIVDQHNQQVTQKHFAEEAERQRLTGNPARGAFANGDAPLNKRARVHETIEEIAKRAEKYRQDRINGVLPPPAAEADKATPPAAQPFGAPPGVSAPPFPLDQQLPPGFPSAYPPVPPGSIPGGLPQRPGFGAPPPGSIPPNGAPPPEAISASLDDLIKDVAEPPAEPPAEKKSKKDKNIKLVFFDESVSPEEKMARLPRYGDFMRT